MAAGALFFDGRYKPTPAFSFIIPHLVSSASISRLLELPNVLRV
jgi:hypothetical protein